GAARRRSRRHRADPVRHRLLPLVVPPGALRRPVRRPGAREPHPRGAHPGAARGDRRPQRRRPRRQPRGERRQDQPDLVARADDRGRGRVGAGHGSPRAPAGGQEGAGRRAPADRRSRARGPVQAARTRARHAPDDDPPTRHRVADAVALLRDHRALGRPERGHQLHLRAQGELPRGRSGAGVPARVPASQARGAAARHRRRDQRGRARQTPQPWRQAGRDHREGRPGVHVRPLSARPRRRHHPARQRQRALRARPAAAARPRSRAPAAAFARPRAAAHRAGGHGVDRRWPPRRVRRDEPAERPGLRDGLAAELRPERLRQADLAGQARAADERRERGAAGQPGGRGPLLDRLDVQAGHRARVARQGPDHARHGHPGQRVHQDRHSRGLQRRQGPQRPGRAAPRDAGVVGHLLLPAGREPVRHRRRAAPGVVEQARLRPAKRPRSSRRAEGPDPGREVAPAAQRDGAQVPPGQQGDPLLHRGAARLQRRRQREPRDRPGRDRGEPAPGGDLLRDDRQRRQGAAPAHRPRGPRPLRPRRPGDRPGHRPQGQDRPGPSPGDHGRARDGGPDVSGNVGARLPGLAARPAAGVRQDRHGAGPDQRDGPRRPVVVRRLRAARVQADRHRRDRRARRVRRRPRRADRAPHAGQALRPRREGRARPRVGAGGAGGL
ncbi:MAG: Penicillin-binding protein 2 (PBP-2), partial [uncultured Solirubrobacteraceae bacterium]